MIAYIDVGLAPNEIPPVRVHFIEALVNSSMTNRAILDNGSIINFISPPFVKLLGLTPRKLSALIEVKLANNKAFSMF